MKLDKKCLRDAMKLYLVSDRTWLNKRELSKDIECSILGGATFIQIREKDLDQVSFIQEAQKVCALCKQFQVPFVVNDDVDVALAVDADGVHIGQSDMDMTLVRHKIGQDKLLGVSVQTVQQALKAQQKGADYLGVGAMFSTHTKEDADHVSFETLTQICDAVDLPVVAIGGIHHENILQLKGTHIDGVAVVSAIMASADIKQATIAMNKKCEELLRD